LPGTDAFKGFDFKFKQSDEAKGLLNAAGTTDSIYPLMKSSFASLKKNGCN
jgi:hypothetical protein